MLKKADNAKSITMIEGEKEQIKLAYNTVMADKLQNNKGKDVIISTYKLQKELTNQSADATATDKDSK